MDAVLFAMFSAEMTKLSAFGGDPDTAQRRKRAALLAGLATTAVGIGLGARHLRGAGKVRAPRRMPSVSHTPTSVPRTPAPVPHTPMKCTQTLSQALPAGLGDDQFVRVTLRSPKGRKTSVILSGGKAKQQSIGSMMNSAVFLKTEKPISRPDLSRSIRQHGAEIMGAEVVSPSDLQTITQQGYRR